MHLNFTVVTQPTVKSLELQIELDPLFLVSVPFQHGLGDAQSPEVGSQMVLQQNSRLVDPVSVVVESECIGTIRLSVDDCPLMVDTEGLDARNDEWLLNGGIRKSYRRIDGNQSVEMIFRDRRCGGASGQKKGADQTYYLRTMRSSHSPPRLQPAAYR